MDLRFVNFRPKTEANGCNSLASWRSSSNSSWFGLSTSLSAYSSASWNSSSSSSGMTSSNSCDGSGSPSNPASTSVWKTRLGGGFPFEELYLDPCCDDCCDEKLDAEDDDAFVDELLTLPLEWPFFGPCWPPNPKIGGVGLKSGNCKHSDSQILSCSKLFPAPMSTSLWNSGDSLHRSKMRFPRLSASYIWDTSIPMDCKSRSIRRYLLMYWRTVSLACRAAYSKSASNLRFWNKTFCCRGSRKWESM